MGKTTKDVEDKSWTVRREKDLYGKKVRYRRRQQQEEDAEKELKEYEKQRERGSE